MGSTLPSRSSIAMYLAKARLLESPPSPLPHSPLLPSLMANSKKNIFNDRELSISKLRHEVELQQFESGKHGQKWDPQPRGILRNLLSKVKAVYLAGGGGAGRAYPAAFIKATHFGLDLNKIEIVNATSVGAIQGLMITLGCSAIEAKEILINMPTETFQDWDLKSALTFYKRWGLCYGVSMEAYFRQAIQAKTGLVDPTFKELFDAGYKKEFRIITTNVTKREMEIFSYKNTPDRKVATIVALACSVPFLFPPLRLKNDKGEEEIYTDGGLVQNYPWGIACEPDMPLDEQLGFMFINAPESMSLKDSNGRSILSTIWHYIYSLFWILMFQNPMSLPEMVKQRTVNIRVGDHNVFNFNATRQEQMNLDECGKRGVTEFIRELIDYKLNKHLEKSVEKENSCDFRNAPTCVPAYYLARYGLRNVPDTHATEQTLFSRIKL